MVADAGAGLSSSARPAPPQPGPPPGATVGWRYWQLDPASSELTSVSQRRFHWLPGRPLRAACVGGRHRAPSPGCSCGIYGARDLETLCEHGLCLAPEVLVVGEVALWGSVIPDARGWRGEFAYPRSLRAVRETLERPVEPVVEALRAYGVPVGTIGLDDAVGEISAATLANQAMARAAFRLTASP